MLENLKIADRYDGFLFLAESARNPPILKPHRHVELELNVVQRGAITYVVGGRRYTFPQRSLLWMYPAQEHQLVDRTADAQYFVAVFKPGMIRHSCRSERYEGLKRQNAEGDGVLHTLLEPDAFDLARRTMEALLVGSLDPDLLNREAGFGPESNFRFEHSDPDGLNAGLRHLLLQSWRFQRAGKASSGAVPLHPAVRKALAMLGRGEVEMTLAQLARRCSVSEAYLSRIFARQVGVSLTRYRNSARLGRFWDHYREPEQKTLLEAMYAAGFGSYAQFYKVYREAYGCGPRESLRRTTRG
jgi:methylphosphotriester-DNA--protein-cysteine methyltransferase